MAKLTPSTFQTKKTKSQIVNPNLTGLVDSASDENRSDQTAGLIAEMPGESLTTNQGLLISDNQNSLRAGVRGPTLLEDHILQRIAK